MFSITTVYQVAFDHIAFNFSAAVTSALNVDSMVDALNNMTNLWNMQYQPASQYVCDSFNSWSTNVTAIYSSSIALKSQVASICGSTPTPASPPPASNCYNLTLQLNALVSVLVSVNGTVTNVCGLAARGIQSSWGTTIIGFKMGVHAADFPSEK